MLQRYRKGIAWFFLTVLIVDFLYPATALAGGPPPDFTGFSQPGDEQLVELYSGDFNYSIPVLELPNAGEAPYKLNLGYNSNLNLDEDASCVGWGWTLNVGAIHRQIRGHADDDNNAAVTRWQKTPPTVTASISPGLGLEIAGMDDDKSNQGSSGNTEAPKPTGATPNSPPKDPTKGGKDLKVGGSVGATIQYSTANGYRRTYDMSVGVPNSPLGQIGIGANISPEGVTYQFTNKYFTEFMGGIQARLNTLNSKTNMAFGSEYSKMTSQIARSFSSVSALSIGSTEKGFDYIKTSGRTFKWSINYLVKIPGTKLGIEARVKSSLSVNRQQPKSTLTVDGLLFANSNLDHLQDYYTEKGQRVTPKELYLGTPFLNYDIFSVSGDGLGGSFRFFPDKGMMFTPNSQQSSSSIVNGGLSFDIGLDASVGVGVNLGLGFQNSSYGRWANTANTSRYMPGTLAGSFRFAGDKGSEVSYLRSQDVPTAGDPYVREAAKAKLEFLKIQPAGLPAAGVSQYQIKPGNPGFQRKDATQDQAGATEAGRERPGTKMVIPHFRGAGLGANKIDGFYIVAEDGTVYEYMQPVYQKNEIDLKIGIAKRSGAERFRTALRADEKEIENYFLDTDYKKSVNAEIKHAGNSPDAAYAVSWLLTAIKGPTYKYAASSVASKEAVNGTAIQMTYEGSEDPILKKRTPFADYVYEEGRLSNNRDQFASAQYCERSNLKIKTIRTRSHIATFTYSDRDDVEPGSWFSIIGSNIKENNPDAVPTTKVQKLDKIVVSRLGGDGSGVGEVIQTTYFEYDYSLCPNNPSSKQLPGAANKLGKLTLKRVYTVGQDLDPARVSSYEFGYQNRSPQDFSDYIRAKYGPGSGNGVLPMRDPTKVENPLYDPAMVSAWGDIDPYGKQLKQSLVQNGYYGLTQSAGQQSPGSWMAGNTQAIQPDPAAYRLKQIKLPTGGEILVNYEQKSYQYVHDRNAMAMVSLLATADEGTTMPKYTINVRDLGIDPANQELVARQAKLIDEVLSKDKFAYYKFLYLLHDRLGNTPSIDNCLTEWIDGYVVYGSASVVQMNGGYHIQIKFNGGSNSDKPRVPRRAAYEYYVANKNGMWEGAACIGSYEKNQQDADWRGTLYNQLVVPTVANATFNRIGLGDKGTIKLLGDLFNSDYADGLGIGKVGSKINLGMSWIRVPMLLPKKAGGVRVKSILYRDPGMEEGDETIFGNRYYYEDYLNQDAATHSGVALPAVTQVISSGVAANEPSPLHAENPLVYYLPKARTSFAERLVTGYNHEDSEGPLGESLLPGASIGYSRVTVQDIHEGATGKGFTVHEFATTKDYPFSGYIGKTGGKEYDFESDPKNGGMPTVQNSELGTNESFGQDNMNMSHNQSVGTQLFSLGLNISLAINKSWQSQGYLFCLNDMPGKPLKQTEYMGVRPAPVQNTTVLGYATIDPAKLLVPKLASQTLTEYTEPGEFVTELHPGANGNGRMVKGLPGKDSEVCMEMRSGNESMLDLDVDVDLLFQIPTVRPSISLGLGVAYSESSVNTVVTSQVVRYACIPKATVSVKDGVVSRSENIAFDYMTGNPVLTSQNDSYGKNYYSLSVPAYWKYPEMAYAPSQSLSTPITSIDWRSKRNLSATCGSYQFYGEDFALNAGQDVLTTSRTGLVGGKAVVFGNVTNSPVTQAGIYFDYGRGGDDQWISPYS
ncbi:hypothetical protein WDZ92_01660, partial [Nostoc sp. NIES-2111]